MIDLFRIGARGSLRHRVTASGSRVLALVPGITERRFLAHEICPLAPLKSSMSTNSCSPGGEERGFVHELARSAPRSGRAAREDVGRTSVRPALFAWTWRLSATMSGSVTTTCGRSGRGQSAVEHSGRFSRRHDHPEFSSSRPSRGLLTSACARVAAAEPARADGRPHRSRR